MRSFALFFCLLALSADASSSSSSSSTTTAAATTSTTTAAATSSTTTTTVAATTSTSTVAASTTTTTTTTPAASLVAAGSTTPVFDFKNVDALCTATAVEAAINSTACAGFTSLTMGSSPEKFCSNVTEACAAKAGAAFVQRKCPPKYAAQASLVCAKDASTFLFTGVQKTISDVQQQVFSSFASTTVPSLTCTAANDYARQWVLADPVPNPHDAIFEAICQQSCWSAFYGYLKASASPKDLATAVTSTDKCSSGAPSCSIAAAGLFAKYFPTSNAQEVALFSAIGEYSRGACVNSVVAKGVCGLQGNLNTNLVAVASTFSTNANSFYVGTYMPVVTTTPAPGSQGSTTTTTPAATQAATTTTTTQAVTTTTTRASTTTTTQAGTTTTTTQAGTTTTTTAAPTTTTTSQSRRRLQDKVSSTTPAATSSSGATSSAAYPWVSVLNGIKDKTTACDAVIEYNKIGCCGAFVGRVSALLGAASDSKLATASRNLVLNVYPVVETLCNVRIDPTCQEGKAPEGAAVVQQVSVKFTLNGVTCGSSSDPSWNKVVASMGEGMAATFVAKGFAPDIESTDVKICDKSFRSAKADLVTFSRRRLQSAGAELAVSGTSTAISKLTEVSKTTAALDALNTAIVAAVQAGAAKAQADAPDDFKKSVDVTKLSVVAVKADAVSAPTTVPAKQATTTPTTTPTTATVSGAPAAMSAIFAPVCAVAAMFAASS